MRLLASLAFAAVCAMGANSAKADFVNYYSTATTSASAAATTAAAGEITITLQDTTYLGNQGALFTFSNAVGTQGSIITDIYFQDGAWLAAPPQVVSFNGTVSWSPGANPNDLPGPPGIFRGDQHLSSSADPPPALDGINNGEQLALFFKYMPGMAFANVEAALNTYSGVASTSDTDTVHGMAIGLKVQGINGASASYIFAGASGVNINPSVDGVPLPATLGNTTLLLGLFGGAYVIYRKRKPVVA